MNRHIKYITCALVFMIASTIALSIAVSAQDNNASLNNITKSYAAMNNTTAGESLIGTSQKIAALDTNASNKIALNVSTVDKEPLVTAQISEMAKSAPEVAAAASSIQVAYESRRAFKLGSSVGGWDPFNPRHKEVESQRIGMPTKPMQDTEKMVFVCDIV
ncbi:MAG: hypothetical protein A4E44_00423 [Methanosaeta sp. PtaB.Bin018]|jgi:hypothetical protein|nr:hypothetical protein [Methanothrix sp.]OPX76732.1 MAG: hypothetical protein A4E44_00423 [Methanosaeta sp. PtaB.Bin018]OPY43816.1 MAG: hypothetical protein A4E46_01652 [Methanosaeta sp. PtaU1.Bin016]